MTRHLRTLSSILRGHGLPLALFAAFVGVTPSAMALVEPVATTLQPESWMAEIHVIDPMDGEPARFCQGALISSEWVLTTGYCLADPYQRMSIDQHVKYEYALTLGTSTELLAVDDFVYSNDYVIGLMHLQHPVANTPLQFSDRAFSSLPGTEVRILGRYETPAIGDVFFNPNRGIDVGCSLEGVAFFTDNAFCYLMGLETRSATLGELRAKVIDPTASNMEKIPADVFNTLDLDDRSRLYLDLGRSNGYPCHEDLGAPILATTGDGTTEIVGVVAQVGMVAALPMCSPSLQNQYGLLSHYQDFIEEAVAEYEFSHLCPDTPEPTVDYVGATGVKLKWEPVEGATGYKLFYTTMIGYRPMTTLDVGSRTEISTNISSEFIYHVTIAAYNDTCSSEPSFDMAVWL